MKLPGYKQDAPRRAQGVDPGVYRAQGAAAVQAFSAVGQVGKEMEAHYQRQSVVDYNRAKAGATALSAQILNEQAQTPYMKLNDLPEGVAQPANVEMREEEYQSPTGETLTRQVEMVPTHTVAAQLYEQQMGEYNKQVTPNMTKLAQGRYSDVYNYEIAPKSSQAIQSRAYAQQQAVELVEYENQLNMYIEAGDEEGIAELVSLNVTKGTLSQAQGIQQAQQALESSAKLGIERSIESGSLDVLAEMPARIDDDVRINADDRARLKSKATTKLIDTHFDLVGDAGVDRDAVRLRDLKALYEEDEDKDGKHPTGLDGSTRLRLVNSIKSITDGWSAGANAGAKANQAVAKSRISSTIDSMYKGGHVDVVEGAAQLEALAGEAYDLNDPSESDLKQIIKIQNAINDAPLMQEIARGTEAESNAVVAGLREAARGLSGTDKIDAVAQADRIEEYEELMAREKIDNGYELMQRQGMLAVAEPYNPDDPVSSLQTELHGQAATAAHYGAPQKTISDETAARVKAQWESSDIVEQMALGRDVAEAYGNNPDLMRDFSNRLWDNKSDAPTLMAIAARGDAEVVQAAQAGKQLLGTPEGQAMLATNDWEKADQADTRADLIEVIKPLHSVTWAEKTRVAMSLTAAYVSQGVSVGDAQALARRDVLGGSPVNSTASSHKVLPPPDVTGKQFQRLQQGIKDKHYRSLGYTGHENMRELVTEGDVVYVNDETSPTKYNLLDTRDDVWIRGKEGELVTVDITDPGGDAGSRGRLDRLKAWAYGESE